MYAYRSLDADSGEIRLVKILKARHADDALRCELKYCRRWRESIFKSLLDRCGDFFGQLRRRSGHLPSRKRQHGGDWGSYAALSYMWGARTHARNILLDGEDFKVTSNLHAALWQLRSMFSKDPSAAQLIWIDAICINQHDIAERNQQVPRMRQIYKSADMVYCFLTPCTSNTNSQQGLDLAGLQRDWECVCDMTVQWDTHVEPHLEDSPQPGDTQAWQKVEQGIAKLDSSDLLQVLRFTTGPYWERLWIVQEVVLADKVAVFAGDRIMLLHNLLNIHSKSRNVQAILRKHLMRSSEHAENLSSFGLSRDTFESSDSRMESVICLRDSLRSGIPDLADALTPAMASNMMTAVASDQRDKVYGSLGMMNFLPQEAVQVDYKKAVADVYIEFAAAVISSTESLRLLEGFSPARRRLDLPSWVVDFTSDVETIGPCKHYYIPEQPTFQADIEGPSTVGRSLVVSGLVLGQVSRVSKVSSEAQHVNDVPEPNLDTRQNREVRLSLYHDMADLFFPLETGKTQYLLPSADYLRTMVPTTKDEKSVQQFFLDNESFQLPDGQTLSSLLTDGDDTPLEAVADSSELTTLLSEVADTLKCRKLAVIDHDLVGWVPHAASIGDSICILKGLEVLGVVRAASRPGTWHWIGPAYLSCWRRSESDTMIDIDDTRLKNFAMI